GGIKRGMAENLPFPSFIHLLFLEFAFTGRDGAARRERRGSVNRPIPRPPNCWLKSLPPHFNFAH
ncbi:TPA: hypothetical protein ACLBEI_000867, partial [Neisseria meningitidis]